MKSLINKVKKVAKRVTKVAAPVAGGVLLSTANVNAQEATQFEHNFRGHDQGAVFKGYEVKSDDMIEEKVFFNPVTGKNDRFYIQHLDKEGRKIHEDDLDIVGLPYETTYPMMGLKSSDVEKMVALNQYNYLPTKQTKLVLTEEHVPNRCPDQIVLINAGIDPEKLSPAQQKKKANEIRERQDNFISRSNVKDYLKNLSGNNVLELGNGEMYFVVHLPKEEQKEGMTNHLLIPINDNNHWSYDPVTKDPILYGTFYRGILQTKTQDSSEVAIPAIVDTKSGLVGKLESNETDKVIEEAQEQIQEESKKKGTYFFIAPTIGANYQPIEVNSFGIEAGVQKGPVSASVHYMRALDQLVKDSTAVNPNNGNIFNGTETHKNINGIGGNLYLHLFSGKRVEPFIGGGATYWTFDREVVEGETASNGTPIKQNTNYKKGSEISYRGLAGVNFKSKSGKHKLGLQGGWDTKSKFNGAVRYSVKIGQK